MPSGRASAAVALCCLTATYREVPAVLLSPEHSSASYTDFFERNKLLDERQRALDEAQRQVLLQTLGQGAQNRAFSQSLYMETDAAPSTGMLQEYWKDFTSLPPSKRPGSHCNAPSSFFGFYYCVYFWRVLAATAGGLAGIPF